MTRRPLCRLHIHGRRLCPHVHCHRLRGWALEGSQALRHLLQLFVGLPLLALDVYEVDLALGYVFNEVDLVLALALVRPLAGGRMPFAQNWVELVASLSFFPANRAGTTCRVATLHAGIAELRRALLSLGAGVRI